MKITELYAKPVLEEPASLTTPPPSGNDQNPANQDVGKLTATISSLQKQVQDLQKSAIQQNTNKSQVASGIAATNPVKQPTTTISGTSPSVNAQRDDGVLDAIKKLAGVKDPTTPAQPQPAPGVNQPPQMVNMRIKQQLAKSQGGGSTT